MKIIFKGKIDNLTDLPKGTLPPNAVMFKEPKTSLALNLTALGYSIPVLIFIALVVILKSNMDPSFKGFEISLAGIFLSLIMIIPHELLHAIAFPKDADVEIWYNLKSLIFFCFSTCPTNKARFIFLSALPNLVFGIIPILAWLFIPIKSYYVSNILFSFATFSLLAGVGDLMNIVNALFQMPKGTLTQLSGFNSYWYYPESEKELVEVI